MFKHAVLATLARIESKIDQLSKRELSNSMTLAELKTQVDKNTSLEESAVTLITGIAAQLAAAKSDPAAIQALSDELVRSAGDLTASITANTTAAPPPPPPPPAKV